MQCLINWSVNGENGYSIYNGRVKFVKIKMIKTFMIFICTLLLAFAFPMQVISSSTIPSIFPYLVLFSVFLLTRLQSPYLLQLRWNAKKQIMFFISIYLAWVFFHTGWQAAFGVIKLEKVCLQS
jgi:hypothetical protein